MKRTLREKLERIDDDLAIGIPVLRAALCVLMAFTALAEFGGGDFGYTALCSAGGLLVLYFTDDRFYGPLMDRLHAPTPHLLASVLAFTTAASCWAALWFRSR